MTGGRAAGYTPFADAPPFQEDEETPLPVSISADEMSHLNKTGEPDTGTQADADPTILSAVLNFIWQGGSPGDAWLHMTAAQVGQVILTLPYTMAQTGMVLGILLQLGYAMMASWTAYLMNTLYMEHVNRKERLNALSQYPAHPNERDHIIQYHEVIGGLIGPWGERAALFFNVVSLLGLAVVQIIACASDAYYLYNGMNKRTWTIVWGLVSLLTVLLPSFQNYRAFSFFGLVATTFTAWYMMGTAVHEGQQPGVTHAGPLDPQQFFTGATNILFTFGGHAMAVEVMHAMLAPSKFSLVYLLSSLYVFTLTLPNTISVYWAHGDSLLTHTNALSVLPVSPLRSTAVVLMVAHQCVAFGLFITPLYFVWEKLIGTHHAPYQTKVLSRVPIVLLVWFLATAFPFFGPVNSLLGAFTTTFSTYVVPCIAFNMTYHSSASKSSAVREPPAWFPTWNGVLGVNLFILVWVVIFGVVCGGWASLREVARQVDTFGMFDPCYQC
ncbi:Lymphocyte transmembrane adapter 1, variant 3 [Trebouxia sp. C0009 RCD-2024]